MSEACRKAKIEGFITNHSLRRTGTTRLFRSGIDRKLIKEFTGHSSDAVDAYAITSDQQREKISKILTSSKDQSAETCNKVSQVELSMNESTGAGGMGCCCNKQKIQIGECDKIGTMIDQLLEKHKGCKATIKLEIEFNQ